MSRSGRRLIDPSLIESGDVVLHGADIGLPMLEYLALSRRADSRPITWHAHDGHEILVLLRGSTSYEFPEGKKVSLSGGQFMLVPAGTRHRGVKSRRMPSTLCAILFKPAKPRRGVCQFLPKESAWMERQCRESVPGARRLSDGQRQMVQSLAKILEQAPARPWGCDVGASLRLLVSSLILESVRTARQTVESTPAERITRVVLHLERHFDRPMQISDLTEIAKYSRARLFTLFKEETGLSPNDWLQRRRVEAASALLRTTDRKLEDIAAACGFSSAAYCCQVFRKYTGKTPGQHRVR